ncbi:uncharacterized protein B0I36DRAFT_146252 [Microdochium trichocladiopsis]|uniref:Uncharacterized protein n=1 Tax=Microdochium trichocladiopsis TaxID=1682393 RepID=A0A9P8Y5L5_9PEZI|nr:uncharacterized protein B0I36DRAFT_146252 [Microdochium trichocladiopsis]KAH7028011.1 hypothetical protein B0I36DRAFT_146252 [Microdochium trichocladiopsis]
MTIITSRDQHLDCLRHRQEEVTHTVLLIAAAVDASEIHQGKRALSIAVRVAALSLS